MYQTKCTMSNRRTLGLSILSLLLIELVVCVQYRGPAVVSEQNADALTVAGVPTFSAERALKIHQRLFDGTIHPAGSAANDAVRRRLEELLREHGWDVETQACALGDPDKESTPLLHNVIARRPEQNRLSLQPLVLATHFDSCKSGPGAGDAGACVAAVVEAARLLTLQAVDLKRPVWLLFTDGEEGGLLGAKAFTGSHPLSKQQPLVLNFDARGTAGPVAMFETHRGNSTAIDEWVNTLARPRITGSLFTAIYRLMPNGTDFSVFRNAGWQGFNFAILDGAHRYHQPDDTFDNLDPRSVQHFGEHALSVARGISKDFRDLQATREDRVYFDILGLVVIHFPVWWCVPLRFAVLIVAVQLYGRQVLRQNVIRQAMKVWLTMLLIITTSPVVGWLITSSIYHTAILPRAFVWYGHGLSFAMWCLSLLSSLAIAHWLLRRIDRSLVWNAFWLGQATTCMVVSIYAPEFSYLLSIPAAVAIALTFTVRSVPLRTILATIAAGILLIPVQHLLSIALGPRSGVLLFPAFALVAMPMLAALGTRNTARTDGGPAPSVQKETVAS